MRFFQTLAIASLALSSAYGHAETQVIEIEDAQAVQLWWSGGFQCANNYWYNNPPMMQGGWCSLNTGNYTYSGKKLSMWRFDLSAIPESAVITSLKVRLWGDNAYGQAGNLFKLGMKTGTGPSPFRMVMICTVRASSTSSRGKLSRWITNWRRTTSSRPKAARIGW